MLVLLHGNTLKKGFQDQFSFGDDFLKQLKFNLHTDVRTVCHGSQYFPHHRHKSMSPQILSCCSD